MGKYEAITQQIIDMIEEEGEIPWNKPWNTYQNDPVNPVSGTEYSGLNRFLLSVKTTQEGYESNRWVTFNQASDEGGHIQKGAEAMKVIFWKMSWKDTKEDTWLDRDEKDDLKDELTDSQFDDRVNTVPMMRYYSVFNLDQTEDLDHLYPEEQGENDWDPVKKAEEVIEDWEDRPEIEHRGNRAFYHSDRDVISLPPRNKFPEPENYYHTFFHEAGHATGHEKRLSRPEIKEKSAFGSTTIHGRNLSQSLLLPSCVPIWESSTPEKTMQHMFRAG